MDDAIGGVVQSLKDRGLFENTAIVFSTDVSSQSQVLLILIC